MMPVTIGTLARHSALMAYASVMASELIRRSVAEQPRAGRIAWLRRNLNVAHRGLGDQMAREYRRLKPELGADQAAFDALRLALANRVASVLEEQSAVSGLGTSERDINAVFCGLMGTGTVGGTIALAFSDPQGATIVGAAGREALTAAGCDAGGLAAQAEIAQANLRSAQLDAARERSRRGGATRTMYVAVGAGVVVVLVAGLALVALKK